MSGVDENNFVAEPLADASALEPGTDFDEVRSKLENQPVDSIEDSVEESGIQVRKSTQYGGDELGLEYLNSLNIDLENGFMQVQLDNNHEKVRDLGLAENSSNATYDAFVPAILGDKVLFIGEWGTPASYNIGEDTVEDSGALNSELIREMGARFAFEHQFQLSGAAENDFGRERRRSVEFESGSGMPEEVKQQNVKRAFRDREYHSLDHEVSLEVGNAAYNGVSNWLQQKEIASNLFDVLEEICTIYDEDPEFSKDMADLESADKLKTRYSNRDFYRIPGTDNDGRLVVTESNHADYDAKIEIAGTHTHLAHHGYEHYGD